MHNLGCGREDVDILYVVPEYCVGALVWICGNYVEHAVFLPSSIGMWLLVL
jgi:hypothetical protein